jgi:hypothetical protein
MTESNGMIIEITRPELEKIMSSSAVGITRWFGAGGCPCQVDDTVRLVNRGLPGSAETQLVAVARIRAVRPHYIGDRQSDKEMLRLEGYDSFAEWQNMFNQMYGQEWNGTEVLHCLYLILEDRATTIKRAHGQLPMLGR